MDPQERRRSKRNRDDAEPPKGKRRRGSMIALPPEEEELEFEDGAGDDFDSEDDVEDLGSVNLGSASEGDGEEDGDDDDAGVASDCLSDEEFQRRHGAGDADGEKRVWHPSHGLAEGEKLDFNPNAYKTIHAFDVDWSCLSFDIIRDQLGYQRKKFPLTLYAVTGTQAETAADNKVYVMRLANVSRTNEEDDEDESDDSDAEDDPTFEYRHFNHPGGVNRVRTLPQEPHVVATWADTGDVHIFDTLPYVRALDAPPESKLKKVLPPLITFSGHASEGFAMDWSTIVAGRLLTGDNSRYIHLWERADGGWTVDKVPYTGHTSSVEDIQWSPAQPDVFASCSSDQTVRIWDARDKRAAKFVIQAHACDVNCISWNRMVMNLLVSGGDDGSFNVWDLRYVAAGGTGYSQAPQHFQFHTAPITSLEWHPTQASSLAVAGADDQISLWDMAVEADEAGLNNDGIVYPPQLLFLHHGQTQMKEVHWHPQIPGLLMSTAFEGFHVFRPHNF